jgi:hypothetical protein
MSLKIHPAATPDDTTSRHVRLHLPNPIYRSIRHRLADLPPSTSISEVLVELIEVGLAATGGRS